MPNAPLTTRPAWQALKAQAAATRDITLAELFAADASRGTRMTAEAAGVYLDYSKNRVDDRTLALLVQLAEQSGLRARIDAMFRGDRINVSENRSVLHVALRAPKGESIVVDGRNVVDDVLSLVDTNSMSAVDATRLFPAYLVAMERLADFVDQWRHS